MQNELKAVSRTADELRVANYIILFGGRDLTGEFFTAKTLIESSYTKSGILHVDFEHGLDPDGVGMDRHEVLGFVDWKTARIDDVGVFVERALNRQARYMGKIEELIDHGVIGTSSESIRGKVQKTAEGEIVEWPLVRDSLTFTPAEPRMLRGNALQAAKSLHEAFPHSKSLAIVSDLHGIKSALDAVQSLKDVEALLRDAAGLSRADACALVSRIKSLAHGERDAEAKRLADMVAAEFQRFPG